MTNISKQMATHGLKPGAFVYMAASDFVAKDNLDKALANNTKFLTRLPATCQECSRVKVYDAVYQGLTSAPQ